MSDQKNTDGISVEVKADGAAARVSDQALSKFGQAITWLMPRRSARVRITEALAKRTIEKILAGTRLDDDDRSFVGRVFERECRLLGNREAAAEEIHRVLPEVKDRLKQLPPAAQAEPSQSFINRAEGIASEVSEDEIRQLFARIVAGEICRPGSISLRALEAVRLLNARNARAFEALCRFVLDGNKVIIEGDADKFLVGRGLNSQAQLDLNDAGLIQRDTMWILQKEGQYHAQYGQRQLKVAVEQGCDSLSAIWIPMYWLTRIGQELAAVLPFNPDYDYFDMVSTAIAAKVGDRGFVEHAAVGSEDWTRVAMPKAG